MDDLEVYKDEALFWANYSRRHLISFECAADLAERLAPEMQRLMKACYHPQDWVPPEVPETLHTLKEAGFRLGVVSNRTKSYQEQLDELGLGLYFECAVAAGEVSIWKPEPGIFQHALRQLGVREEGCMYVGDNYYADVLGAARAGLRPVLLDPEKVFPNVECTVIRGFGELARVLSISPMSYQEFPNH
jgi:HAD superfamily hydrolase (TIGR01549 family)